MEVAAHSQLHKTAHHNNPCRGWNTKITHLIAKKQRQTGRSQSPMVLFVNTSLMA